MTNFQLIVQLIVTIIVTVMVTVIDGTLGSIVLIYNAAHGVFISLLNNPAR